MPNARQEKWNAILATSAIDGYTWIHIAGYYFSGKSVLLQEIVNNAVANDKHLLVYTFNPQGMGDKTIKDARRLEKSIYLLHRKCQDDLQDRKVFIAIHEWHLLFNLVSDRERFYGAIVDIFRNSKKWGIVFAVTSQTVEVKPIYGDIPRETIDGMQLKIVLGDHALEVARKNWKTTDTRYLWLLQQERPCVICHNKSIELAIVPEVGKTTKILGEK